MNEKDKNIIFLVNGGLGKSIMSTSVIRAIKKQYINHNIIVISGYEPPFTWNKNVYRTYLYNQTAYFYNNYIKNKDVKIFTLEPYQAESYLLRQKHLTETWCDILNVKHDGIYPDLTLNPRMSEIVKDKIKPSNSKPLMLIQSNGGGDNQISKKSWARDIPIEQAQKIVNYYSKQYRILHLRREDQPKLDNTEWLSLPFLELFHLIPFIKKSLLIDSFMQHAFAALNKKTTVCWVTTSSKVFGYEINDNILPNSKMIYNYETVSFLEEFDFTGNVPCQFPYENINIFNIDEIISSIEKQ